MTDKIIIKTSGEEKALIPDQWVLGTGLTTDSLYVVHTDAPLMIVQYPPIIPESKTDHPPCTVYLNGTIDPESFNKLFAEAWQLLKIYKDRRSMPYAGAKRP